MVIPAVWALWAALGLATTTGVAIGVIAYNSGSGSRASLKPEDLERLLRAK